jgi:hypothetical protein
MGVNTMENYEDRLNSTDFETRVAAAEDLLCNLSVLEKMKREAERKAPKTVVKVTLGTKTTEYWLNSFDVVKVKRSLEWMNRK